MLLSKLIVAICLFNFTFAAIPLLPAVGGAAAVAAGIYMAVKCKIDECCDSKWISCDEVHILLSKSFSEQFFGQHIAAKSLLSALTGYCNRETVKSASRWKPLVLSLHGPTGVGKSHVSHLIADGLFKKGMRSNYVHYFDLATDLRTEKEQSLLHDWILGNASLCSRQLFIFNEIDKADHHFSGSIDKLHKFFDYGAREGDIDLTNVIYIFAGNLGTAPLISYVTSSYRSGQLREEISDRSLELLLERAAFDQKAGLYQSEIVKRKLIDAFVPFLPLERIHVEKCIRAELEARFLVEGEDGLRKSSVKLSTNEEEEIISSIIDNLQFEPEHEHERFFAATGCKEIQRLVQKATYEF